MLNHAHGNDLQEGLKTKDNLDDELNGLQILVISRFIFRVFIVVHNHADRADKNDRDDDRVEPLPLGQPDDGSSQFKRMFAAVERIAVVDKPLFVEFKLALVLQDCFGKPLFETHNIFQVLFAVAFDFTQPFLAGVQSLDVHECAT